MILPLLVFDCVFMSLGNRDPPSTLVPYRIGTNTRAYGTRAVNTDTPLVLMANPFIAARGRGWLVAPQ